MGVDWIKLEEFFRSATGFCDINSSSTQMITRCYNCERSSNKDHAHLYIKIDENMMVFNCFRCEESGNLFDLIRIYGGKVEDYIDPTLISRGFIEKGYRSSFLKKKNIYGKELILPDINIEKYKFKIQYIRGRLGFDVDIYNIPGLIVDFYSFVDKNRIRLDKTQEKMIDSLELNFVGFVNIRGTQITCRNINETSDFRY